jgi:hypothetical protein
METSKQLSVYYLNRLSVWFNDQIIEIENKCSGNKRSSTSQEKILFHNYSNHILKIEEMKRIIDQFDIKIDFTSNCIIDEPHSFEITDEYCISRLKTNGYKIMKPITKFEEV